MRLKLKALLWMIIAGFIWIGCRKMDQGIRNQITMSANETNFFSDHKSDDPYVQSMADYVARNNSKYKFVDKVTRQIGYPYWDKAVRVETKPNAGVLSETNPDSVNITYIPFVRENENFVNASLIIKTTPTDTFFRYLQDWEYRNFNGDSTSMNWHADDVFKVFATLDRFVFNRTQFRIIDTSLFAPQVKDYILASGNNLSQADVVYNLEPSAAGPLSEVLAPFELCYSNSVCIAMSTIRNSLTETSLPSCPPGYGMVTFTECVIIMAEVETSGGGYGGTTGTGGAGSGSSGPILGGGSGSSGGGGWIPPPPNCTPPIIAEDVTNPPPPCPPGWTPTGGGTTPPSNEPIDSILSKYSRKFRHVGDSIYRNHSLPGNKEYFFAGAHNNTTIDTVLLNIRTDNDSMSVNPNLSVPGHSLLFIWHSHVSASINTADRRSFSHADIDYLRRPQCLKPNFTSFADCGNKQYALIITDVVKAQAFFNSHNRAFIEDNYWTTGGGTMQDVDERCVKSIIGSAATNGIAFYVSTNSPNFSTWSLLNP